MRTIVALLVLLLAGVCVAQAFGSVTPVTGSIGFSTPNLSEANASPTGDINTATMFTLVDFSSTNNTSGIFAHLPIQDFGTVSFTPANGTSLTIMNALFGMFTSDTFTTVTNTNGFLNLIAQGEWASGSFNAGICKSGCDAEMRISLTQTPPMHGQISDSETLSTSFTQVPEIPTALMFLSGIGLLLGGARLRKVLLPARESKH